MRSGFLYSELVSLYIGLTALAAAVKSSMDSKEYILVLTVFLEMSVSELSAVPSCVRLLSALTELPVAEFLALEAPALLLR